jgi:tetratricopeptide (TPR) repeat protein
MARWQLGDTEEARRWYSKAAKGWQNFDFTGYQRRQQLLKDEAASLLGIPRAHEERTEWIPPPRKPREATKPPILISEAKQLERKGRCDQARAKLQRAVDYSRTLGEQKDSLRLLSRSFERRGEWDRAAGVFTEIIDACPGMGWVRFELGELRTRQGKSEEAVMQYLQALELTNSESLITRVGRALTACGWSAEAVASALDSGGTTGAPEICRQLRVFIRQLESSGRSQRRLNDFVQKLKDTLSKRR